MELKSKTEKKKPNLKSTRKDRKDKNYNKF